MATRSIVKAKPGDAPEVLGADRGEEPTDKYKDRLLKYIPAEVLALYLALSSVLASVTADVPAWLPWAVLAFGMLATYLHLNRIEKVKNPIQLAISVGAFFVWAFTLGGPFAATDWYHPYYGALLLPIYTFLAPVIES